MHLASLHLDRFRGLRHCSLRFAPTTVLIGENNCGKSSILDAIGMLLSESWLAETSPVGPLDFHRGDTEDRSGPIHIDLTFAERRAGEWSEELRDRLGASTWTDRDGLRSVRIRGEALLPRRDGSVERRVLALGQDGRPLGDDGTELHAIVRRLKPVLRLRTDRTLARAPLDAAVDGAANGSTANGSTANGSTANGDSRSVNGADVASGEQSAGPREPTSPREDIAARLAELHDALVDPEGSWPDLPAELRDIGALLDLDPAEVAAVDGSSDRLVEILRDRAGRLALSGGSALPLNRQGVGTQALVMVLLLGAFVTGGAGALDPLAEPLVVLEDPEAHLHPRTLALLARGVAALRAQKLIVTHSGDLLAVVPTEAIRRLHRRGDDVRVHQLDERTLTADESRKVAYHIRSRRRTILFSRCWLLVEGETEFWLLPALAQRLGYDLTLEGVACVEFAQCGLKPLIKTADDFGIQWHLLADGDSAGTHYADAVLEWVGDAPREQHVTTLGHRDIEASLWHHGYAQVYRDAAGLVGRRPRRAEQPGMIIAKAIRSTSKPSLAQRIIEAVAGPGSPGTPPAIERAVEAAVALARAEGVGRRTRRGGNAR